MINPTNKIYRQQIIEGVSIPAIIHNDSYFFVDLDVYADGRVNCWNFEDMEHFIKDVNRGWVTLSIPDNRNISIHGLGSWAITGGAWLFTPEKFIGYVRELVKTLNPGMLNMYKYHKKVINGVAIGESGNGHLYKENKKSPHDIFPETIVGDGLNVFYKLKGDYHLVKLNIFPDQTFQLCRLEMPMELTTAELEEMIASAVIVTAPPVGARVHIYGLGSFTVKEADYAVDIREKLIEIREIVRGLNGEPSSVQVCREAYQQYIADPTARNKALLKVSYENVPDHHKMYVGDMDTKDIAVRMIIYGEQEIEQWSHYRLAKRLGEQLPSINIPKPKDEDQ
nr:hypothetical protein [uncultured Chitinophaga sp.]